MTFRNFLKKKLKEKGYPIEVSSYAANGRGIRGAGQTYVTTDGIRLEKLPVNRKYANEVIILIYTQGFITVEEMNEILAECKKEYGIPENSNHYRFYIY